MKQHFDKARLRDECLWLLRFAAEQTWVFPIAHIRLGVAVHDLKQDREREKTLKQDGESEQALKQDTERKEVLKQDSGCEQTLKQDRESELNVKQISGYGWTLQTRTLS
jgi:hypothetical protein